MKKHAEFDKNRIYRYALGRVWDDTLPFVLFVGLNPSTADETKDDRTINRCINFAKDWGYGGISMANLFSFRTKDPKIMKKAAAPVGPDNDTWLLNLHKWAGKTIVAWGNDGGFVDRDTAVLKQLGEVYCLRVTKNGYPGHPLYIPGDTKPFLYTKKAGHNE